MKKWIAGIVLLCLMVGCIEIFDPNTGGTHTYQLDPNVVAGIQTGLSVTSGTAQAVSPIWPPATLIVALAGLAAVVVEKLGKKKLRTKAENVATAGGAIVRSIEAYKIAQPEEWKELKLYLLDHLGPGSENIIRAWRGKLPKE